MAQHDYVIANQGFPAFRSDLNDALAAVVSNNSGATEPSTMFAHQIWVDTAADPSVLKIRNADNDAWITIGTINQTGDTFKLTPAGGISTDTISELTSAAGVTIDGVLLKDSAVGSAASPVALNSLNYPNAGSLNFRNRIINGDMRIDQRNAGASKSIPSGDSGGNVYTVDRWIGRNNTDGVFSVQQDSSVPAGFNTSSKITVTTADASIGAAQWARFNQRIEGFNIADLGWGTANAKTVTLSFWVRSSLTGTFAGNFTDSGGNRNYVFTYTISVADTWEYKTVTLSGDTSGTWQTTTSTGIDVVFSLAAGSNYNGTAGAWTSSDHRSVSGAVQVLSTLNATWYITGVQLEVGSVATPFERRPYGTELSLCQRYYYRTPDGAGAGFQRVALGFASASTTIRWNKQLPTVMRAHPTLITSGSFVFYDGANLSASSFVLDSNQANDNIFIYGTGEVVGGTAYRPGHISADGDTDATFIFNAEL